MKKIQLLSICLLLISGVFAQNYKLGVAHYNKQDYDNAITELTKVIENKDGNHKALNYRGLSYLETKYFEKARADFGKAVELKPKEAKYSFGLGKSYFMLGKHKEAAAAFEIAIERNSKMLPAYDYQIKSYMQLKQFKDAVASAEKLLSKGKKGKSYYTLAVAQDSLMLFKEAIYNFGRARFYDSKIKESYIGLGYSHYKLGEYGKAMEAIDRYLGLDEKNIQALSIRSDINIAENNTQKAIDDLSKILVFEPDSRKYRVIRADYYQRLGQYQNAIIDLSKVIALDKEDYVVYYKRATVYELMSDFKLAVKDYETLKKLSPYDGKAQKLYDDAKKRLYELNKESNNPTIVILDPASSKDGKGLQVPKNQEKYTIKGQIKDESNIAFIKINGKDASFNKDTLDPLFELEINMKGTKEVNITAFDVYQNSETWNYNLIETEVTAPIVKLLAPYSSDDGTVYLDTDDPTLYVEGVIKDESLIKSILIEGATASFTLDDKNPKFSATINVMNKNDFTVIVEDEYGNRSEKKFIINRESVALLADNPMGKTWIIFIENSDYTSFASLDGPAKDVTMMKSAFAKYKINNLIHKKDMTKAQLERFFSIELRDLVRSNRVNSLLVWYAGHGKFINESGYWIPTDAKRDEEFTYFNINNLKAGMQSYSKYITHTLVVTDACESGPSFYQAMRSTPKDRSCNDWQATKFKSSQVFSSAGYELASDNSQFTKTFASTLASNPNSCIPIETIVTQVKTAVSKDGAKQKPKFGKIAGLEDEDGTFFFIKK